METRKRNRREVPEGITPDMIIGKLAEITGTATDFISKIEAGSLANFKDKNFGLLFRRISDIAEDFDHVAESAINRAEKKAESKPRTAKPADPKAAARAEILNKERAIKLLSRTVALLSKQNQPTEIYTDQINQLGIEIQNLKQQYGITDVKGPGRPKKSA